MANYVQTTMTEYPTGYARGSHMQVLFLGHILVACIYFANFR